ncbi:XRE family transcriptional regulator [Gluconobacter sp. Gdi]|uniref:LexA family transcriptional regulator n=1 Tax=Gluconobacter sp. Gdi TaxID=2691888 RepID=UPI001754195A|nr:XRE family transcriptional regulator [Gluconobacter sp. Gdi]GFE98075.1 hypothetical protein DmGdi_31480 [Gluconobacter sp. Gdi]
MIDREWFKSAIKRAGFRSQNAFAADVGLTGPKLTNLIKGDRRAQADEIQLIAKVLGVSETQVKEALGIEVPDSAAYKICGYVFGADRVVIPENNQNDFEDETVNIPIFYYDGIILRVRGESMAPRYKPNELIGIRTKHQCDLSSSLIGKDVVAKLSDGQILLKTLHRGSMDGRFSLISVNQNVEPIIDAEIVWAHKVDFHVSE